MTIKLQWLAGLAVASTALVIACSLIAVVWQLGLIALFGFELDPFSILVPFLVFAIGVSHGAQKMNGIMREMLERVREGLVVDALAGGRVLVEQRHDQHDAIPQKVVLKVRLTKPRSLR